MTRRPVDPVLARLDGIEVPDLWDEITERAARPSTVLGDRPDLAGAPVVGIDGRRDGRIDGFGLLDGGIEGTVTARPRRSRRPAWVAGAAVAAAAAVVAAVLVARGPGTGDVVTSDTDATTETATPTSIAVTVALDPNQPSPPTAARAGRLYVADPQAGTLLVVDATVDPPRSTTLAVPGIVGVAAATDGSVWVVTDVGAVARLDPDGTLRTVAQLDFPAWDASGVRVAATASRDALWVADLRTTRVSEVAADGTVRPVEIGHGIAALGAGADDVWVLGADRTALAHLDAASGRVTGATTVDAVESLVASDAGAFLVRPSVRRIERVDPADLSVRTIASLTSLARTAATAGDVLWIFESAVVIAVDGVTGDQLRTFATAADARASLVATEDGAWIVDTRAGVATRYSAR